MINYPNLASNFNDSDSSPHLFIGNLPLTCTETSLLKLFHSYHFYPIKIRLMNEIIYGRSIFFAFVTLNSITNSIKAKIQFHGYMYEGKSLKVVWASDNDDPIEIKPTQTQESLSLASSNENISINSNNNTNDNNTIKELILNSNSNENFPSTDQNIDINIITSKLASVSLKNSNDSISPTTSSSPSFSPSLSPSSSGLSVNNKELESNSSSVSSVASIHLTYITYQIKNLVTEETIKKLFLNYGEVLSVHLKKSCVDSFIGRQYGYGFIHYPLSPRGISSICQSIKYLEDETIENINYRSALSLNLRILLGFAKNEKFMPSTNYPNQIYNTASNSPGMIGSSYSFHSSSSSNYYLSTPPSMSPTTSPYNSFDDEDRKNFRSVSTDSNDNSLSGLPSVPIMNAQRVSHYMYSAPSPYHTSPPYSHPNQPNHPGSLPAYQYYYFMPPPPPPSASPYLSVIPVSEQIPYPNMYPPQAPGYYYNYPLYTEQVERPDLSLQPPITSQLQSSMPSPSPSLANSASNKVKNSFPKSLDNKKAPL